MKGQLAIWIAALFLPPHHCLLRKTGFFSPPSQLKHSSVAVKNWLGQLDVQGLTSSCICPAVTSTMDVICLDSSMMVILCKNKKHLSGTLGLWISGRLYISGGWLHACKVQLIVHCTSDLPILNYIVCL